MISAAFEAFYERVASQPGIPEVDDIVRRTTGGTAKRENYCIVFPPAIPELDDQRFTAPQRPTSRMRHRWDVRPVATSTAGLTLQVDALIALVGAVLIIPDRKVDPLRLVTGVEEGRAQYDQANDLRYIDLTFETTSRPL